MLDDIWSVLIAKKGLLLERASLIYSARLRYYQRLKRSEMRVVDCTVAAHSLKFSFSSQAASQAPVSSAQTVGKKCGIVKNSRGNHHLQKKERRRREQREPRITWSEWDIGIVVCWLTREWQKSSSRLGDLGSSSCFRVLQDEGTGLKFKLHSTTLRVANSLFLLASSPIVVSHPARGRPIRGAAYDGLTNPFPILSGPRNPRPLLLLLLLLLLSLPLT